MVLGSIPSSSRKLFFTVGGLIFFVGGGKFLSKSSGVDDISKYVHVAIISDPIVKKGRKNYKNVCLAELRYFACRYYYHIRIFDRKGA